ncbi:MAG: hypothetical protein NC924_06750 [Candidatus Omnitrophica bacterium]|nr:hypothetical protein [Candidatus Omnitrophota bacterium]
MVKIVAVYVVGAFLIFGMCVSARAGIQIGGENGPLLHGFAEAALGVKLSDDTTKSDSFNYGEQRVQLKTLYRPDKGVLADWYGVVDAKADLFLDEYFGGKTGIDVRSLNLALSPREWLDCKIGRQVFTWGTGDYLFINDLFPKDYISFYIGRDDEYLKKPSDGLKCSLYAAQINADIVVIPFFTPNTVFDGDRLSFFDPFQAGIAGIESDRRLVEQPAQVENTEVAARIYRTLGSYEAAVYLFRGFYKNPVGYLDESRRELYYPRLNSVGASLRGPGLGGIVHAETGYYQSVEDTSGKNRLIQNSQLKAMAGYSKDLGNDWSAGGQYLIEQTLDYGRLQDALAPGDYVWDEVRHLCTLRLTKLFKQQTVRATLFLFYSPSDRDTYWRPSLSYDISDSLHWTSGANLAWGEEATTEFGQAQRNKNIYTRLRYSF